MDWERAFGLVSMLALPGWAALILLPRWPKLVAALRFGLVGVFLVTYAVLVFVYFFSAQGNFNSLAGVKQLFMNDPVALAGWVHYLAFDLFVGIWIALEADARGTSRLLQTPILAATFMFGPVGLLLAYGAGFLTRSGRSQS